MPKKFDIFISYRRKGGFDSAKLLYDRLRLDGYSVSFDMDTLERGNFDSELESRVKKCRDFVVVLNPGVFDRFYEPECNPKDDWVRREIACAIAEEKNIVPIILDGFQWPKKPLPTDVEDLARKNGIDLNPKYFEAMYANLKQKFLISKPSWTIRHKIKIISFISFLSIALLATGGAYLYFMNQQKILEIQSGKQKADSIANYKDSIIRYKDSIANKPREQRKLVDSAKRATVSTVSTVSKVQAEPAKKQVGKNEDRTLHWMDNRDVIGIAMYEKLQSIGVQKTPCSGNGITISANRPSCKRIDDQIMCSYLPTLTLTDCNGKLLAALKITAEFIGMQENEAEAKKELADGLRNADFGNIISSIEKHKKM